MKRLLLAFLIVLSGCSLSHRKPKPPEPKPVASGIPSIGTGELRVDGERVIAAGLYDLLVNADYYTEAKIDQVMKQYKDSGCNLFRVWGKTWFRNTDWQPWAWTADGKFDLSTPNENFYNRMEMIATKADQHGICIAWVPIDFWSIRQGFGYPIDQPDSLCPLRHIDSLSGTKGEMMTLSGYFNNGNPSDGYFLPGHPRGCRIYKIDYGTGLPLGCRDHPAWFELFRRMTLIAAKHQDMIYLASELSSGDADRDLWDKRAMIEYTILMRDFVREVYAGECIIGTSTTDVNKEVYDYVDIADIHSLGYGCGCDPDNLVGLPNKIVCFNSDGCTGKSYNRYDPDWIARAVRNAWAAGGFFESKADSGAPIDAICEGFRRATQ